MSQLKARELMEQLTVDDEPAVAQVVATMALAESVLEVAHSLNNIAGAITDASN
jgi:flagellar hook-basal body complex protein FliE